MMLSSGAESSCTSFGILDRSSCVNTLTKNWFRVSASNLLAILISPFCSASAVQHLSLIFFGLYMPRKFFPILVSFCDEVSSLFPLGIPNLFFVTALWSLSYLCLFSIPPHIRWFSLHVSQPYYSDNLLIYIYICICIYRYISNVYIYTDIYLISLYILYIYAAVSNRKRKPRRFS